MMILQGLKRVGVFNF